MRKCVIVGTGHRGTFAYLKPLTENFGDCIKICGVFDTNKKRAEFAVSTAAYPVPVFDDFDTMLNTTKPDAVLVASVDSTHDHYIVKSLDFGCDVFSEKPVTTTSEKFRNIYEAEQRSGKKVMITFNLRFLQTFIRVKELLMENAIGDILSVNYEWMLNTSHGADYFRRWHRNRKNSGSLLIHKSTHHFDLLNWFLDDIPEKVNAFGTRRFYGPTREKRSERCLTCPYKKECEFYFDIAENPDYKSLYLDCEDADGYYRDKCVFSEEIDIEDSLSVNIKYTKGATACYSLTAFSPYEGAKIRLNGTKGRMEVTLIMSHTESFSQTIGLNSIKIFKLDGETVTYNICNGSGNHGGADDNILDALFRGKESDPLNQLANSICGANSIGIGIAANISLAEDRAVYLKEFYDFL